MAVKVALKRMNSYKIENLLPALREAVELAGGFDIQDKRVLLKPNILRDAPPERALATHPDFVRAAIRLCREAGALSIYVGDSPGVHRSGFDGKISGIRQVVEEEGALWVDFLEKKRSYPVESPLIEREFKLSAILERVDRVISLPKLKTHELMYYTGAVKNLYGLIPGYAKAALHVKYPSREEFGKMLVDLLRTVKADYALMDGILAMEGPGPGNGYPRAVGCIAASPSCFALDMVCADLIGYRSETLPAHRPAFGLVDGIRSRKDIETVGDDPETLRPEKFELIPRSKISLLLKQVQRIPFVHRLETRLRPKPVFDHQACILCGECVAICASRALSFRGTGEQRRVAIDYKKCIRCYCCHEVCPVEAIRIDK